MRKTLTFAAVAAASAFAASAVAQVPSTSSTGSASGQSTAQPPSGATTPPATSPSASTPPAETESSPSAAAAGANASVTAGMSVKDKTGATIGQVTDVKTDASGKKTATIKMGADSFAVDTASLAVEGGAATVNASRDEIQQMLKK